MLDDVVERIGEENVVQVITDNAVNYKATGYLLMQKKYLYWTPYVAHYIDLILEDFEKNLEVHQVTIVKRRRVTTHTHTHTHIYIYTHIYSRTTYFHAKKVHKMTRFDQACCHSICHCILDSWMFE